MKHLLTVIFVLISGAVFSQQQAFDPIQDRQLINKYLEQETDIYEIDSAGYYYVKGFEEVSSNDKPEEFGEGKQAYYYFLIYTTDEEPQMYPFLLKTEDFVDPLVLRINFKDNICTIIIKEFVKNNVGLSTSMIELQLPEPPTPGS